MRSAIVVSLAVSVGAALAVVWGKFSYTSACTICGEHQHTTEWQVPVLGFAYWRSNDVQRTAMSAVVMKRSLVPPHAHAWLFAAGSNNGAMCAIGEGRRILGPTDHAPTAFFVDTVAQHEGNAAAQTWLSLFLDPKRSQFAMAMTFAETIPPRGFADASSYQRWRDKHRDFHAMAFEGIPGR